MFFKTFLAVQDMVDYSRSDDGTWRAEFRGPIQIAASGRTLEACRHEMHDSLDAALEAWLTGRTGFARRASVGSDQ